MSNRGGQPSAQALGQLLLLQSAMHVLPDEAKRSEFVCAGLARLPGVAWAARCLDGTLVACVPEAPEARELCRGCAGQPQQPAPAGTGRGKGAGAGCGAGEQPQVTVVPIETAQQRYGQLLLGATDGEMLQAYVPFVGSVANTLALLMETRQQEQELRGAGQVLEQRVRERTEELRQANRALEEKEHFVRGVLDTVPAVVYIDDLREERWAYLNSRVEQVLGYTAEQLQQLRGEARASLLHPDDLEAVARARTSAAAMGDSDSGQLEFRMRHTDGSYRVLRAWSSVFARDESGQPTQMVGAALDLTETREAEEQRLALEQTLRHAVRLESVGRLAGGVAHDFNNMITVINSYATLAMEQARGNAELFADLAEIERAGQRAATLTRQLLAFSRRQVLRPQLLDINQVVRGMVRLLARVLTEDIELQTQLGADLGPVLVDAGQLEQVLLKLAANARDAMPKGGRLTISTSAEEVAEASDAGLSELTPGAYVALTVRDTGVGMDSITASQAFEPFFTTKGVGEGSGLGLSVVHGIVKQSGGEISVSSRPGQGSEFRILLPVAAEQPQPEPSAAAPRTAHAPSEACVMVVEDEPEVRRIVARILRAEGYQVETAVNGEDALRRFRSLEHPVDLVLLDVVMPGLNGRQVADAIWSQHPGLPVLFMSGHPSDAVANRGVLEADWPFLHKPFSAAGLRDKVRQLLEAAAHRA